MKKVLLASSILALSAGFASAEITLSGDARMGIIDTFGTSDAAFTSRARVKFTLSGETDGGLSFGASFRANDASGASSGDAGEVFISGAFGKLTMGDVDGAAQQAVGNVDGVGLTGLGDVNEAAYVHNVFDGLPNDPTAAYEYSAGAFTGILSVTNPSGAVNVLALGAKYAMGDYTFSLGYEQSDGFIVDVDHVILGANATFGAISVKANYGRANFGTASLDQYHLSATYTADALAVTAFYSNEDDFYNVIGDSDMRSGYGIGASYDLGGGAKVVGGYAKDDSNNEDAFDLGVSFSF